MYQNILVKAPYGKLKNYEFQTQDERLMSKHKERFSKDTEVHALARTGNRRRGIGIRSNFFTAKTISKASKRYKKSLSNVEDIPFEEEWLN